MDIAAASAAGIAATAVMTGVMYLGFLMGVRMDMPRMHGLLFVAPDNPAAVYVVGAVYS